MINDGVVKRMVERFLIWKLPENFNPDGGIIFDPVVNLGTEHQRRREPVGTNLFDFTQTEEMVRFMVDGLNNLDNGRTLLDGVATEPHALIERLKGWLVELEKEANLPDRGDGWAITDKGRAERAISKTRADDLRALLALTPAGTGQEIWQQHPDGRRYAYEGRREGKCPVTGDWLPGVNYRDIATGKRYWTTEKRWLDRFYPVIGGDEIARTTTPPREPVAGEALDIANAICVDVAELPDRTSPDDWPDAMLVTHDELRDIILSHIATPAPPTAAGDAPGWQWDDTLKTYVRITTPAPPTAAEEPSCAVYREQRNILTSEEWGVVRALGAQQELSDAAVIRQALRLYQLHHKRLMDGETFSWSGDTQRLREFAGGVAAAPETKGEVTEGMKPNNPYEGCKDGTPWIWEEGYAAALRTLQAEVAGMRHQLAILQTHHLVAGNAPFTENDLWRLLRQESDRATAAEAKVTELQAEVERMGELVYVPGIMRCAKCSFVAMKSVLNANTGIVSSSPTKPESCPNDGSPLWRVSERTAGNEAIARASAAEAEVRELREALTYYADESRWTTTSAGITPAMDDKGFRARQALAPKEPS